MIRFLAVAILIAALVGGYALLQREKGNGDYVSDTEWGDVRRELAHDHYVTRRVALHAFVTLIAPLPGVPQPKGKLPANVSGTLAVRSVLRYWQTLTPAQRRAVRRVLDTKVPKAESGLAAFRSSAGTTRNDWEQEVKAIRPDLERAFHWKLKHPVTVTFGTTNSSTVGGPAYAWTFPVTKQGGTLKAAFHEPWDECLIEVTPRGQAFQKVALPHAVAHELTHCFQVEIMGIESDAIAPWWLMDGSAEWVGSDYSGYGDPGFWNRYLSDPRIGLFNRDYDAFGFFTHLSNYVRSPSGASRLTRHLWEVWASTCRVKRCPSVGTKPAFSYSYGDYAALLAAFDPSGQANSRALSSWATEYARRPDITPEWEVLGTFVPQASVKAKPSEFEIKAGSPPIKDEIVQASVGFYKIHVDSSSRFVLEVDLKGFGGVHWEGKPGDTTIKAKLNSRFCVGGTCTCGSKKKLPALPADDLLIALTGRDEKGSVSLRAQPVDATCQTPGLSLGRVDQCVTGRWQVDRYYFPLIGGMPGEPLDRSRPFKGRWLVELKNDGTYVEQQAYTVDTGIDRQTGWREEMRSRMTFGGKWHVSGDDLHFEWKTASGSQTVWWIDMKRKNHEDLFAPAVVPYPVRLYAGDSHFECTKTTLLLGTGPETSVLTRY